MKRSGIFLLAVIAILGSSFVYLDRPLAVSIQPASFTCFNEEDGHFLTERFTVSTIYGIGLAYANHINETASVFDPLAGPPVFIKSSSSATGHGSKVSIPSSQELVNALEEIEPGLTETFNAETGGLRVLLDHEVELALVLLESVSDEQLNDPRFVPHFGFFIANDLSSRSIAIMGEGQGNRYDYWGASKSFPGFTPLSERVWVPENHLFDGIPCITLQTYVNGTLRQNERTDNLIYRPKEMLYFIKQRYPQAKLEKGDVILSGTPGGVIFTIPRWKSRLAEVLGLDRYQKLAIAQQATNAERFLKAGDQVRVSGQWLGEVSVLLE